MNYNLTPGISLDNRTIYFSIPSGTTINGLKKIAQTESSDNYIAEDIVDGVSRGYYHYLDNEDNEVIGLFYSSDGTNLSNIKLPVDFGTILSVDETSVLYEYISRASHEKVYVHSEDFDKRESLDKDTILANIEETVKGYGVPVGSVFGFAGEASEIPPGYEITESATLPYCFDTVADMKASDLLIEGDCVITKGYYSANDGGSASYLITSTPSTSDYQEELNNELYATLINGDNNNIIKYGGVYGVVDDTQKEKNTLILTYMLNKYNGINLNNFEVLQVLDLSYALKSNSYLNNINLECYGSSYTSIFYISGERADKIKIGKMNLSNSSNSSYKYGLKLGDYLTNNFAPFLVIDDLTISNFDYPFMFFSWNSSINRIQSYNCKYAGVLLGTSTNINAFYANSCDNGVLLGMMIDENDNVVINNRTYFSYSNIAILNEDSTNAQSYLIGIGHVDYTNINELGYENSNLNNIFYGCYNYSSTLTIGNIHTSGQLTEQIYKKHTNKTNKDIIIINNIRGEYLTSLTNTTNECQLIINYKDQYLSKIKGIYVNNNIMLPYSNPQRTLVSFSDIYKNGGGSTSDLASFNTYGKAIGILNNNEVLNIKLRGSRTSSSSTSIPNRQIILLAKLIIGDADQYNNKKIFGETLINVAKDIYSSGGAVTVNTSNTIDNLTISIDNTGDLPVLQIIPPTPVSANYSYNYVYMLEIIGGAYTEIYKTTIQ